MKAGSGAHFEQADNPQAAVDGALLIVGERVSDAPTDKQELVADGAAIRAVVAPEVQGILTDSGFDSEAAVAAVEAQPDGTPSGVTGYSAVAKGSHHKTVADLLPQPEPPAPGPEATAKEKRAPRLKTSAGQALYRLRKQTVEPVFGIIKEGMGFRRFGLRGRAKVAGAFESGGRALDSSLLLLLLLLLLLFILLLLPITVPRGWRARAGARARARASPLTATSDRTRRWRWNGRWWA